MVSAFYAAYSIAVGFERLKREHVSEEIIFFAVFFRSAEIGVYRVMIL